MSVDLAGVRSEYDRIAGGVEGTLSALGLDPALARSRRGGGGASKGASKAATAGSLSAKNGPASRGRSE